MKEKIISEVICALKKNPGAEVALLGLGKTNRVILDIITKIPELKKITVYHSEDTVMPRNVNRQDYPARGESINADIVFTSPSVRRENLITSSGVKFTSDTELLFSEKVKNSFLISGSDGKSTVSAITAELLNSRFPDLFLGGNIGTPVALCELRKTDAIVIELSSFNLKYTSPCSDRAIITNITPNHLNWHESYEEYISSKKNLLTHSREPIVNVDTPECVEIANKQRLYAICSSTSNFAELRDRYSAEHIFTLEGGNICIDGNAYVSTCELQMKEKHNAVNFMSAMALTHGYAERSDVFRVAHSFKGLPHRCDRFLSVGGANFIDSSIDTTPERTAATLRSLGKKVKLILGGRGKGLCMTPLLLPLASYAEEICVYGEIKDEIESFLDSHGSLRKIPRASFEYFSEAVEHITENIKDGDTVLLSPAATSYGEFRNFEERGELFRKIVHDKYEKI